MLISRTIQVQCKSLAATSASKLATNTRTTHRHILFRQHGPPPSTRRRASSGGPSKNNNGSLSSSEFTATRGATSFLIGTTAGLCGSLAGMGGGFVMIPLMTSGRLLRLSQHAAHGTSLFAVATTGLAGALGYSGQVDYEAAMSIALCGMVTARAGALATSRLSEVALRKALGVFMLAVAPLVPAKQYLIQRDDVEDDQEDGRTKQPSTIQRFLIPAAIGSCSGFLAGLFGVGGGAVVVPALTLFTDMNHYEALGTSLTAMVLPALSGTFTHFSKGNVNMRVAPFLAVGAFCGAFVGSKLAQSMREDKLKWGFSGIMVVLGLRALIK